ncbi:MAG: ATP-grasp domain-containing protein [Gemmataceae bacterium]
MNILLTCAGRRNYLVRYFQETLQRRGRVLACDAADHAPAFAEADCGFVVPAMDHPDYFPALLAICREEAVSLVVSVNDVELTGLAEMAPSFRAAGTIVVVAAPGIVALCLDKWRAFQWLREANIATPNTWLSLAKVRRALSAGEIAFPLLVKPRWGTSSVGVERVETERELELAHEWVTIQTTRGMLGKLRRADAECAVIIQEWASGQEYGLDIVHDLQGQYAGTLARRKLIMRSGNTDRAVSVVDPELERLGETIGQRLGHIGALDVDVMVGPAGVSVLDLNPRLGGGYPFSHLAGANLPAALLAWAAGAKADPSWLRCRPDVLGCKFDELVVMNTGGPASSQPLEAAAS